MEQLRQQTGRENLVDIFIGLLRPDGSSMLTVPDSNHAKPEVRA